MYHVPRPSGLQWRLGRTKGHTSAVNHFTLSPKTHEKRQCQTKKRFHAFCWILSHLSKSCVTEKRRAIYQLLNQNHNNFNSKAIDDEEPKPILQWALYISDDCHCLRWNDTRSCSTPELRDEFLTELHSIHVCFNLMVACLLPLLLVPLKFFIGNRIQMAEIENVIR